MLANLIVNILIGAAAGWLAGSIMGSGGSWLRNIILGLVGGVVGSVVCKLLGLGGATNWIGSILISAAGACLLIWVARKLFK